MRRLLSTRETSSPSPEGCGHGAKREPLESDDDSTQAHWRSKPTKCELEGGHRVPDSPAWDGYLRIAPEDAGPLQSAG
jgi:hypothetical protein